MNEEIKLKIERNRKRAMNPDLIYSHRDFRNYLIGLFDGLVILNVITNEEATNMYREYTDFEAE